METTRTIIAVKEDPQEGPICFPRVCVWKQANGTFVNMGLREEFPVGGNVFVHRERIGGYLPERDSYGVFTCIESQGERSAHWSISGAGNDLCEVVRLPQEVTSLHAVSDWIEKPCTERLHKIFQGSSEVFLYNRTLGLVGPVTQEASKCFRPLPTIKLYAHPNLATVVSGPAFILKRDLTQGETVQISKSEAVKTLIHRLWKQGKLTWLTRDNNRELANVVLEFTDLQGVSWVKDDLKKALDSLASLEPIKDEVCQLLARDPRIDKALQSEWDAKNSAALSALENARRRVTEVDSEAGRKASALEEVSLNLETKIAECTELDRQILLGRDNAKKAFEEEIQKLTANPAQVAALKSFVNGPAPSAQQTPFRKRPADATKQCESLQRALQDNLHDAGLTTDCAREVAAVITVSARTGQPISFLGDNADYLAFAAANAFTRDSILTLDTPAGLLSPLNWPEEVGTGGFPTVIIKSINRSAIDIVLGDLKTTMLNQANQAEDVRTTIFMTLLPFDRFSVPQLPFSGPIIDEKFLEFNPSVSSKPKCYSSQVIGKTGFVEVADLLGAFKEAGDQVTSTFGGLSLKHLCVALGTFGKVEVSTSQAEQALFKFWLLPRFKEGNAQDWISGCASWISNDPKLKAYYEKYDLNRTTEE